MKTLLHRSLSLVALFVGLSFAAGQEAANEPKPFDAKQAYLDLFKAGKLFDKKEYKAVRAAVARQFESNHASAIKDAFGEDAGALSEWFANNNDIKEEFFIAIDDRFDDVPAVLRLFKELWQSDADAVRKYPNLAIATSVVWDKPREAVYDYGHHQVRTKSILPEAVMKMTAQDNFKYFVDNATKLKAKEPLVRMEFLPWEFQVYLVDTRTPTNEREWAVSNYLGKRSGIGKCYSEIVYDKEMLQTGSRVCKLNDKPYTLESIKRHGGVCAMQADFAARVGKSLGVPAAYVGGESQSGDLHAWVMWVEVLNVTRDKITFSLQSHGRYLGDNYYTGNLKDPQTGQRILDRDMERRLSALGNDRAGKRMSDLNMRIYPIILEELTASKKRLAFLDANLKLCPFNEGAWLEFAELVKQNDIPPEYKQVVTRHMNEMLRGFAKYPDFTWKVAPDLIAIHGKDKQARNLAYTRLAALYETSNRPDLACEARLKWSELLEEDKQFSTAATGLRQTILKFSNEGRYVPKLTKQLSEVCSRYPEGKAYLTRTYIDLTKQIKPTRGDDPSKYAVKMYEEALAFLEQDKKNDRVVQQLKGILAQLQSKK